MQSHFVVIRHGADLVSADAGGPVVGARRHPYGASGNGAGSVDVVTATAAGGGTISTTDYGYGTDAHGAVEHRGSPTSATVTAMGAPALAYAASYDGDGAMTTQVMPGGLTQVTALDEAGEPVGLTNTGDVTVTDLGATPVTLHDHTSNGTRGTAAFQSRT